MKVCILSMYRVHNFGSVLQSYGLKCMLEQLGHSVTFLDIVPNEMDNRLLGDVHIDFSREGESGSGLAQKLKKVDRYLLNRMQQKWLWNVQNKIFDQFRCQQLPAADPGDRFDCCVIGSDEVFNCLSRTSWGFTGQLFGDVPQADRVITYAASCGSTVYDAIPDLVAHRIRKALSNVSALSVRDGNTRRFCAHLTDLAIQEHLDPALVADFHQEITEVALRQNLPRRYCIVYSYYNRICDRKDIWQIQKFCRNHSLEILSVGAPQKWISNHLVMPPFEMLKLFQNAVFVITDTFHGTIFSAKYVRQFAVMIRPSNRNKLGDLVSRLGLEKHVLESFDQLESTFCVQNDPGRISALVEREQKRTLQYLRENVTGI